jgi:hypothetical protein
VLCLDREIKTDQYWRTVKETPDLPSVSVFQGRTEFASSLPQHYWYDILDDAVHFKILIEDDTEMANPSEIATFFAIPLPSENFRFC